MNTNPSNVHQFLRLITQWMADGVYEDPGLADPEQLRFELFECFERDIREQEDKWKQQQFRGIVGTNL